MPFSLSDVAPRLARARDAWVAEQREIARERHEQDLRDAILATKRLRADRLVAHRELQALRAAMTRDPKYIRYRHRKLDRAQADRKRLG